MLMFSESGFLIVVSTPIIIIFLPVLIRLLDYNIIRSLYHMHPNYVVSFLLDQDGNNNKLPGAIVTA